jgi:hypothetical protein
MPLYTFYPCHEDGHSDSFTSLELADDDEAYIRSLHILDQHPSAAHVVAWAGERKVLTRSRVHPDLRAVLSQSRTSSSEDADS